MRKHHNDRKVRSSKSEISRLQDAIRRESDKVQREHLRQRLEHFIRSQNGSR